MFKVVDVVVTLSPKERSAYQEIHSAAQIGPMRRFVASSDTKLQALMVEIRAMCEVEKGKALVFGQYKGALDLLQDCISRNMIGNVRIHGNMNVKERATAFDSFRESPDTRVLLASTAPCAMGPDVTTATHVFLMGPDMDSETEQNAIKRARLDGQTHSVTVKRFVAKDTIESMIASGDVRVLHKEVF